MRLCNENKALEALKIVEDELWKHSNCEILFNLKGFNNLILGFILKELGRFKEAI